MKVTRLRLTNFRSFESVDIQLSPSINVVIGPNNSGKTTLLNALSILQKPCLWGHDDARIRATTPGKVEITVNPAIEIPGTAGSLKYDLFRTHTDTDHLEARPSAAQTSYAAWSGFEDIDGRNVIIPYHSKRKVGGYSEAITLGELQRVPGNLGNLYAKIDQISNPNFQPAHDAYVKACEDILGFRISAVASGAGKKAALTIRNEEHISIDRMGDGTASLLGLIVDLCRVKEKIFLIEEPENDIHPKALKRLLDLIAETSNSNQFVITTHSNIVLKHLGAVAEAKVFSVAMWLSEARIPTSTVRPLATPEERREALEDLGYEAFDFDLWDYWIFFEESSAERFVRDFFIPWYCGTIAKKVRTFAARSISQVAPKFADFNQLFVFLHLQQIYKDRVWVVVDAGNEERKIVEKLTEEYGRSGWSRSQFLQLSQHDFEKYYPQRFAADVEKALGETDGQRQRDLKKTLIQYVVKFCTEEPAKAKEEFADSARDVIELLRLIEASIITKGQAANHGAQPIDKPSS
jgi:predicted ATPase